MKITEQRIREIIVEELELAENEQQSNEDVVKTLQAMREKFKNLYANIPKIKDADTNEIKLLNIIIDNAIELIQTGNAKQPLLNAIKKLGVKE